MKTGLLFLSFTAALAAQVRMEQLFAQLRNSPPELYAFLYRMPKGADLHNHVAGAVYAETMIETAAQDSLCLDEHAQAILKAQPAGEPACQVPASRAEADNRLFNGLVDS